MNLTNQILPTRKEIINLAGRLTLPDSEEYFELTDEANELLQLAYQSENNAKSVKISKEAYDLDPFLSDALLNIANRGKFSFHEKLMYLHEALRISAALIPEENFKSKKHPFWLDIDTRPFMRTMHSLGIIYHEAEMYEFAEFYWSFCLDLNPNDNQGIRYLLTNVLLHQNKTKAAKVILDKWQDSTAQLSYARLLLGLLETNTPEKLDELWDEAFKSNPFVPKLILNRTIPALEGPYRMGDESEARAYLSYAYLCWNHHRDAVRWLEGKYGITKRAKLKLAH